MTWLESGALPTYSAASSFSPVSDLRGLPSSLALSLFICPPESLGSLIYLSISLSYPDLIRTSSIVQAGLEFIILLPRFLSRLNYRLEH